LCGMPVAYSILPPAANLPESTRAMSGAWVGKWDYGLCSALIVESVKADGTASMVYVNGSFGGEAPIKEGVSRFQGRIAGDTLTNDQQTFKVVLRGRDELAGTSTGLHGVSTAKFVRH